ncbi:S-layer homology domain-containing protein [Oscillospiraceae bacterium 38-13]
MTLSQSEIAAEGTTAAVRFNTGLTLEGIAILEPSGGKAGSNAIVNGDDSNAVSVKLGAVTLNAPTSPLACTYGDTGTLKVTLTTTPAITSAVEVYSGTAKVGGGNLNEEITIDTSGLPAGEATLTAKLPDGLGENDFTVTVNPKPLTVAGAGAADRAYDNTNEVSITSVDLNGVKAGDTVSVNTAGLKGTITGSDAGTYTSVTLPELTLTGPSAGNYILTQPGGTVSTSVTISKAGYAGNTTGSAEGRFGVTKTFDLKDLLPAGYVLGEITVSDDNGIFADTPKAEGAVLTYQLVNDEKKVGNTGTITIPVTESTNYNSFQLTITVTVKDKFVPALTIEPITAVYNGDPVPDTAIRGTAVSEGVPVPGAWSFAEGQELTTVADSGTKNVLFTPTDGTNYAQAAGTVSVTIRKAAPSLNLTPSPASLPGGGTVTLTLTGLPDGGSAIVTCSDGNITVTEGSGGTWRAELPSGGRSYTFTASYDGDENHNGAAANCTVSTGKITPVLKLAPSSDSLSGGGKVTLTLTGLPAGGSAKVTCDHDITVTAGAGGTWTATLPNRDASYTFEAVYGGNDRYHGASAACRVDTREVEFLPEPPDGENGEQFRLIMETGISEVPPGLENIETLNTPEKLEMAMKTEITQAAPGIPQGNTAVYNVALLVSTDGGATWTPATKDNFPSGGLTVILPYPEGTNSDYRFTVVHMFTTSDFGKRPGDTEVFTPDKVKNTAQGIQVVVTGLSPISVGWTAPAANPEPPSSGGHGGGGGGGGWSSSTYAVTVEKPEHGKVTSSRTNANSGSTVTLTVTPDSGYELDTLTVTDSRGNEIRLTGQGSGKYAFTMPGRAVTVKASFVLLPDGTACDGGVGCPSRGFADLGTVGTWYHEAVDYVLRNGLMGGYGNGTFGPSNNLTRAQFAQILFNKEGRPVVNYPLQYSDVEDGAWYTEAIRWAASQGVVGGYRNGAFGPNGNITREQLAVMLWRYAGSPAAADKELHFNDADETGGYAPNALRWAVENGVLSGYSDGRLDPTRLATRAQAAQMLKSFQKSKT